MAKYAILSDIHSNLEAFKAVLAACGPLEIDHYLCLGDIIGYGANPRECFELAQSCNFVSVVKGNHDEYVSRYDDNLAGFNPHAKAAILWTREQLSDEMLSTLRSTPLRTSVAGTGVTLVHATLDSPDTWGYIFDVHHAMDNFTYQFTQVCFCGHSHVPVAFEKRPLASFGQRTVEVIDGWAPRTPDGQTVGQFNKSEFFPVEIKPGYKYLFNVGSIGQPRNRDPRSSFAVYDTASRTVTRYVVPYDIGTAQSKILAAGLPERLASRLAIGA